MQCLSRISPRASTVRSCSLGHQCRGHESGLSHASPHETGLSHTSESRIRSESRITLPLSGAMKCSTGHTPRRAPRPTSAAPMSRHVSLAHPCPSQSWCHRQTLCARLVHSLRHETGRRLRGGKSGAAYPIRPSDAASQVWEEQPRHDATILTRSRARPRQSESGCTSRSSAAVPGKDRTEARTVHHSDSCEALLKHAVAKLCGAFVGAIQTRTVC